MFLPVGTDECVYARQKLRLNNRKLAGGWRVHADDNSDD